MRPPDAPAWPIPARRLWIFRLIAAVLPLLVPLVLELGLRLCGYGFSPHFFIPLRAGSRDLLVENFEFGQRFFPPALARTPLSQAMPAHKPKDVCRIFIFGESAAMGDPEPPFGFARMLEVLLRARHPEQRFEIVNTGMTAINSHVIREIAKDSAPREGDFWIVYMGNNEVVGPFGAGTIFGAQAPALTVTRASIALRSTRVGQWLTGLRDRFDVPAEWEGMEMFLTQQIRHDDPRMTAVYEHFRNNLTDIIARGREAGARVLVGTVAGNLKDCPPFASLHRPDLGAAPLAEWEKHFARGRQAEAEKNFTGALDAYREAAQIDDQFAELIFRVARCELALGRVDAAKKSFARACDLDTLRFRPDTRINDIIRETAVRERTPLLDVDDSFARHSPHGIAGEELLYEHVHLNLAGNYLTASLFAERLEEWLAGGAARTNTPALLAPDEAARRLAVTDWDRLRVAEDMRRRLQQAPFTNQLGQEERDRRWADIIAGLRSANRQAAFASAAETYRAALASAPDDWVLHKNFAKLLEASGDITGAIREWREVTRLLPHNTEAPYGLGNLADSQRRNAEAAEYFETVLRLRPNSVEARNGLGLALSAQGKSAEAIRQFEEALQVKPRFAAARVNLGQTLASLGRVSEAQAQYETALRLDTTSAAAHNNLGRLLMNQGRENEAAAHYSEALRLNPDSAVAHFNLGNARAGQKKHAEAAAQYAEAARLEPDFADARYNLGLELARTGKNDEALSQFTDVARLQPDFADGHVNLGVALAKAQRFAEAVQQFREALRLQPGNPAAQKFLDKALELRGNRP